MSRPGTEETDETDRDGRRQITPILPARGVTPPPFGEPVQVRARLRGSRSEPCGREAPATSEASNVLQTAHNTSKNDHQNTDSYLHNFTLGGGSYLFFTCTKKHLCRGLPAPLIVQLLSSRYTTSWTSNVRQRFCPTLLYKRKVQYTYPTLPTQPYKTRRISRNLSRQKLSIDASESSRRDLVL